MVSLALHPATDRPPRSAGPPARSPSARLAWAPVLALAAIKMIVNATFAGRYGWHTDELYYADCGRHLAWGFVDFPPLTPLLAATSRVLLGDSLQALRLVASLAGAATLVVTAAMVRDLGGGRRAQVLALLAVMPMTLGANAMFQTVSFDQLAWALVLWAAVRLRPGGDRTGWIALGAALALAWATKYTCAVLVGSLGVGLVATRAGRLRISRAGAVLAGAIVVALALPNLWWQARHGWPSVDFFTGRNQTVRSDNPPVRFLAELLVLATPAALPVWIAGLRRLWRPELRHLGVTVSLAPALWLVLGGKAYYALPVFILLHAAGAVEICERWRRLGRRGRALPRTIVITTLLASPVILPVLPTAAMVSAGLTTVRDDYAAELGWHELSTAVDRAWASLTPAEHDHAAVLAGDYAEAGAIRRFGRSASGHAPPVVSTDLTNRYWRPDGATLRATTLVVLGYPRSWLDQRCATVHPVGRVVNRWDVDNEEAGTRLWMCRLRSGVHLGALVRFAAVP